MAHVQKFTRGSAGRIIGHCEREKSDNGDYLKYRTSSDIDVSKTSENMPLRFNDNLTAHERLAKRLSQVHVLNRKDVNVMCDWVITYPEKLSQDRKSIKTFFSSAVRFLKDRYGEDNVICANIHMDEAQPHIHYCFVPVTYDEKKGRYKVSAKEVLNKRDLNTFHTDLEEHLEQNIGLEKGLIYSGKTAKQGGNKTIKELKNENERLDKAIQEKQAVLSQTQRKIVTEKLYLETESLPEPKKTPVGVLFNKAQWETCLDIYDRLKTKIGALTAGNSNLQINLTKAEERIAELEAKNDALTKANRWLKGSNLCQETHRLRDENTALIEEKDRLKGEFEKDRRQWDQKLRSAETRVSRYFDMAMESDKKRRSALTDQEAKYERLISLIADAFDLSPADIKRCKAILDKPKSQPEKERTLVR